MGSLRAKTKEIPVMNQSEIDRFLSLIIKNSDTDCWIWKNSLDVGGYGNFKIRGLTYKAHRVSYFYHNGHISTELVIDHSCRNRGCVSPFHLRQVDHRVNALENSINPSYFNSIKEECHVGHEYDSINTKFDKNNNRYCLKCKRASFRKWYKNNSKVYYASRKN